MNKKQYLIAIPVYNEAKHVMGVLAAVRKVIEPDIGDLVFIDDGSTDGTSDIIQQMPDTHTVRHPKNRGYGAAIATAFCYAQSHRYQTLVTMDCDGQHEPNRIPVLLEAMQQGVDIVSGSRYLRDFRQDTPAPDDRRSINHLITNELNALLGLNITDAFCGFKAYCVSSLAKLRITETGWGMPLQVWVQAARQRLTIREVAVPRIYLDPNRAFGGVLNKPTERLAYYRSVIAASLAEQRVLSLPPSREHCPDLL